MQTMLSLHIVCALVWLASMLLDRFSQRFGGEILPRRVGLTLGFSGFFGMLLTGGRLAGLAPPTTLTTLKIVAGLMAQGMLVYGLLLAQDRMKIVAQDSPREIGNAIPLMAIAVTASVGIHLWMGA